MVFLSAVVQDAVASSDAAAVARGAALYADNCAACHGTNLEGQANWEEPEADGTLRAPPHDVSGHTWHHPDRLLFGYIKDGGKKALKEMGVDDVKSGMPAFGDVLADRDIQDILAFIKSNWPEQSIDYQKRMTAQDDVK